MGWVSWWVVGRAWAGSMSGAGGSVYSEISIPSTGVTIQGLAHTL